MISIISLCLFAFIDDEIRFRVGNLIGIADGVAVHDRFHFLFGEEQPGDAFKRPGFHHRAGQQIADGDGRSLQHDHGRAVNRDQAGEKKDADDHIRFL